MKDLGPSFLLFSILVSCHASKPNAAKRKLIVGGKDSKPAGRFPYFTIISGLDRNLVKQDFTCGGTLIHPDIVLSAGACLNDEPIDGTFMFRTYTNVSSLQQIENPGQGQVVRSSRTFIKNGDFFRGPLGDIYNDLLLIKLDKPITNISPVKFIRQKEKQLSNSLATAIGLGSTNITGTKPQRLQEIDMTVFDVKQCNSDPAINGTISKEVHICAGNGGDSTCFGDFGGPLLLKGKDGAKGDIQVGVSSYSFCGELGLPNLFVNVNAFQDFIFDGICLLSSLPLKECKNRSPVTKPPGTDPEDDDKNNGDDTPPMEDDENNGDDTPPMEDDAPYSDDESTSVDDDQGYADDGKNEGGNDDEYMDDGSHGEMSDDDKGNNNSSPSDNTDDNYVDAGENGDGAGDDGDDDDDDDDDDNDEGNYNSSRDVNDDYMTGKKGGKKGRRGGKKGKKGGKKSEEYRPLRKGGLRQKRKGAVYDS
jgi:secreted trypsin-like serine protease